MIARSHRSDLKVAGNVVREHPGQFCMAIVGIVLGVVIAWLVRLPLDELYDSIIVHYKIHPDGQWWLKFDDDGRRVA